MQVGDVLTVESECFYSMLYVHLEVKYSEEPVNPLFHYRCPNQSTHQLNFFYSRFDYETMNWKLDPKYEELIR